MARKEAKKIRPNAELYVRKLTVDEALLKLDRYLDEAIIAGLTQFTIVHGMGKGILRHAMKSNWLKARWCAHIGTVSTLKTKASSQSFIWLRAIAGTRPVPL